MDDRKLEVAPDYREAGLYRFPILFNVFFHVVVVSRRRFPTFLVCFLFVSEVLRGVRV